MLLHHNTKSSKEPNTIPIDPSLALASSAFYTKTIKQKGGVIKHLGLVWRLPALGGADKSRYDGHAWEIEVQPEWLNELEKAIQVARERFRVAEIPSGIRSDIAASEEE